MHYGASRGKAEAVLASLPGDGHVLAGGDLADPEAVRAMVDGAAEALGSIDVVVNNAGVVVPHAIDEASWEECQAADGDVLEQVRDGQRQLVFGGAP